MKKSILNIGKTLNKKEQMSINGGSNNCQLWKDGYPSNALICNTSIDCLNQLGHGRNPWRCEEGCCVAL